jgi:hypothetical protein
VPNIRFDQAAVRDIDHLHFRTKAAQRAGPDDQSKQQYILAVARIEHSLVAQFLAW